jgi:hypothetical protein
VNPNVPVGVSNVLQNALDLSAGRRPASAAELRDRLRDHTQYTHQTSPAMPPQAVQTQSSVFGAPTIANQESTFAAVGGSEALTQLLPDNLSKVTSIRDTRSNSERIAPLAESAKPRRNFKFAIAGLIGIFVLALAGLGLYMTDGFAERDAVSDQPAAAADQPHASNVEPPVTLEAESAAANSNVEANVAAPTGAQTERRVERSQSAPVAVKKPLGNNDANAADSDEKVVVNGDSIWVGNVLVNKGRVVTPGQGFDFNMQPPNVRIPNVPIDPRYVTPEQRRKLRLLRQRYPGTAVPQPSPTPRN